MRKGQKVAKAVKEVRLFERGGELYIPFECISDPLQREWHADKNFPDCRDPLLLLRRTEDCDTIRWPRPDRGMLAYALYDAREMGLIPDVPEVLLPDGTRFNIDSAVHAADDVAAGAICN
jgi:hypothetical protein